MVLPTALFWMRPQFIHNFPLKTCLHLQVCEIVIRLRSVGMNLAKLVNGNISYKGPTELNEFTVIKYVLNDRNMTDAKSTKV
jgi:hypothetical protein